MVTSGRKGLMGLRSLVPDKVLFSWFSCWYKWVLSLLFVKLYIRVLCQPQDIIVSQIKT